jgi:ketol-acid reductoisomerase
MRVYGEADADLAILQGSQIAVIGYGNQGRAQALNLRDSGLDVVVGNRQDTYTERARDDGFTPLLIEDAARQGDVIMLLLPDEVAPEPYATQIAPHLAGGKAVAFASGYNMAFGLIEPPPGADVVLVAPRMIGAGVRDLFLAGKGFPSFIGVAQDSSGQAKELALALAKGIGSTRAGVVEVTFAQEVELDLFTEQCFGPAFGHVLTTAVNLLLDEGYPPAAVLLELYMSGELSYTLGKIAELGLVEQTALHSRTSQYGSMSRGMRFMLPELRAKMQQGLEEIRSGDFAREWAAEQADGAPTLAALQQAARTLPMHRLEQELRRALPYSSTGHTARSQLTSRAGAAGGVSGDDSRFTAVTEDPGEESAAAARRAPLRLWGKRRGRRSKPAVDEGILDASDAQELARTFAEKATRDPALLAFSRGRRMTMHYVLEDIDVEFHMGFHDGEVSCQLGPPKSEAQVRLKASGESFDRMLTGRTNALRAVMTGKVSVEGDTRQAIAMQSIQDVMIRLYTEARREVISAKR